MQSDTNCVLILYHKKSKAYNTNFWVGTFKESYDNVICSLIVNRSKH